MIVLSQKEKRKEKIKKEKEVKNTMAKKIDVKVKAKEMVSAKIREMFTAQGFVAESGDDYGFTTGTVVLKKGDNLPCDVQIKLIVPKHSVDSYEKLQEEETE